MADDEERSSNDPAEPAEGEGTKAGDFERKPSDEEERRHDDSTESLPKPAGDDADDDLAEREAGRVTEDEDEDEDVDRDLVPDQPEVGDQGRVLEEHVEPLLEGPQVAGMPTRSLLGILVFVVVFLAVFLALWALLDTLGIFLGILAGTALGLGATKLLADRSR